MTGQNPPFPPLLLTLAIGTVAYNIIQAVRKRPAA
jgi:hypothetical protein